MKVTPAEKALAQDWRRHEREKPLIWICGFGVGLATGVLVAFVFWWLLG